MQHELDTTSTVRPIRIHGVNGIGQESGNTLTCTGRTIPWLQDADSVQAWTKWNVAYRDVFVLDHENKEVTRYNLTSHDLGVPANYAALRQILVDAANR